MAHPSRSAWVDELVGALRCPTAISFDLGKGITANCAEAWELRDTKAAYHLVLQDDAILCRDFLARAVETLEKFPAGAPVSFYRGARKTRESLRCDRVRGDYFLGPLRWGVAVCLPQTLIEPMLTFYRAQTQKQDDARIKNFLIARSLPVYYPIPCLVNHRIGKSLVGDPGERRQAYSFHD